MVIVYVKINFISGGFEDFGFGSISNKPAPLKTVFKDNFLAILIGDTTYGYNINTISSYEIKINDELDGVRALFE